MRNFPPDNSGNIIIPDRPKFFNNEGVTLPSLLLPASFKESAQSIGDNSAFLGSEGTNGGDDDYSLIPSEHGFAGGQFPVPVYPLPIVAYCDGTYTVCSSGRPGDTVQDGVGVTLKNGEQSMCEILADFLFLFLFFW